MNPDTTVSFTQYLFLKSLQHGSQQGLTVLFVGLHLLFQLLLCVLDEVVVLLEGLLDDLSLVLSLLSQVLQQLCLLELSEGLCVLVFYSLEIITQYA